MITPLDYMVNPYFNSTINFPTHCGTTASWSYIVDCEHNTGDDGDGWCSDQWSSPGSENPRHLELQPCIGSDPWLADEADGSFTTPFARNINQASRRFSHW